MIGYDLAETLDAKVGSPVMVISPQENSPPTASNRNIKRFQVVGIFHSGFYQYDNGMAFIRLASTRSGSSESPTSSPLSRSKSTIFTATPIASATKSSRQLGPASSRRTGWSKNREIFHARSRLEQVRDLHRHRPDRLRRCPEHSDRAHHDGHGEDPRYRGAHVLFGVRPDQIRRIFLYQGLLISVVLGRLLASSSATLPPGPAITTGFIQLDPQVYSLDYLPFAPRAIDGVIVGLVSARGLAAGYAVSRLPPRQGCCRQRLCVTSESSPSRCAALGKIPYSRERRRCVTVTIQLKSSAN